MRSVNKFGGVFIALVVLVASCSKKNDTGTKTNPPPPPGDATHVYLYDSAFKNYLQANICPDAFDVNGRLDITNAEVTGFTGTMTIDSTHKIQSLAGIAYFTKMTKLIIQNSLVDSLNLPTTMAIDTLRLLANPDLQTVNVAGCTNMRYIRFYNIPVTTLDFSNLPALNCISALTCGRLISMKIDNDGNLQQIDGFGLTAIPTVNTSTCPNLQRLRLEYCYAVNGLDLSANPNLNTVIATNAAALKTVDLSHNPALTMVQFDESGVDTLDFTHNPALFSASMTYTPIRNLSFLSNPGLRNLALDGCNLLKTVDLRAQTSFNFYILDHSKVTGNGQFADADFFEHYPNGYASPTPSAIYSLADSATRKIEGATTDLYGGLRVPQYLDASALSLSHVLINEACKNNYSLVMARRTSGFVTPALVTVYAADMTTITCNDYNPELETCNQ